MMTYQAGRTLTRNKITGIVKLYIVGMMVLLPVIRFEMPFNTSPLDFWNLIMLPLLARHLKEVKGPIRLYYIGPMWLILLGSLLGTMSSSEPTTSFVTMIQGLYLYVWFVVATALFRNLDEDTLRWALSLWLSITVLHGLFLIAQFVLPELLKLSTQFVGKYKAVGSPRPIGLFRNPNMAASYQIIGASLLLLLRLSRQQKMLWSAVVVLSIVATGSLGILASVTAAGTALAFCGVFLLSRARVIIVFVLVSIVAVALPILWEESASGNPAVIERLNSITLGRLDSASGKRFELWEQALSSATFFGMGPGTFRGDLYTRTAAAHNDFLSFLVERGVIGALGLISLIALMVGKLVSTLVMYQKDREARWVIAVFLSMAVSIAVQSVTHDVFHFRFLWLFLAVQEGYLRQFRDGYFGHHGNL